MGGQTTGEGYLLDVVRRLPVLAELRDGSRSRGELADALQASKTTVHRATTTLEDHGLVERWNGTYRLTAIGEAVAEEACAFGERATTARRLAPLFDAVAHAPVDLDPELFADATVNVAEPGDPYAPVRRLTSLVRRADELRWFDTSTVAPAIHAEVADRLVDGMRARVVLEPVGARGLRADCPDDGAGLLGSENLDLYVHESLPFGLTLAGGRVGVGGYCTETGVLRVYVDTDDPGALAWGRELFQHYVRTARPLAETSVPAR